MSRRKDPDTVQQRPRLLAPDSSGGEAGYAETAPLSDEPSAPSVGRDEPRLAEAEIIAGRYRIVRYLARGGMGEVYEAADLQLGERVALKTIREESRDPISEERFKREIQLSRKVTHPNVCRIFDFGFHAYPDGQRVVFLTMELLGGETLLERVRREGALPVEEATGIVRQIAAGLTAAHAVSVVHRDLKSANVMLVPREDGAVRAVVTDFGLAHVTGGDTGLRTLSGSGGIVGTPGYMAPEQVEGGELSPRTDVYALGVVMYEMATGRLPFEGATPLSIAAKRLTTPPPSPKTLRPELPGRWERTILACLARDPARRPSTPRAVLELLDEELDRTSVRIAKLNRRAPLVRPLLALLVLALAGAVAWKWVRREPPIADELRRRGLVLGVFTPVDVERVSGYAVSIRNAVRTDLSFDLPVVDTPIVLGANEDEIHLGVVHRRPSEEVPLQLDAQIDVGDPGPEQTVEIALRLVDPRTHVVRARIVERGSTRRLEEAVERAGDRLRAVVGLVPHKAVPLDAAGQEALAQVRTKLDRRELADALEQVERALERAPGSVELGFMLGRILAGLRMDVSSALAIRRTLALGEPSDPFWRERIRALALRRDATLSASVLEALARAHPEDLDLQLDLMTVYTQAQRHADAESLGDALLTVEHTPEEQVRIELTRLVVVFRRARFAEVMRAYDKVRARAEELARPGLVYEARLIGCNAAFDGGAVPQAAEVCAAMARDARAQRRFDGLVQNRGTDFIQALERSSAEMLTLAKLGYRDAAQLGGRRLLSDSVNALAIATSDVGTLNAGWALFEEALVLARDIHDHRSISTVLQNMGFYASEGGRMIEASRYLREALEIAHDAAERDTEAWLGCELAQALARQGDVQAAEGAFAEAQQLRREDSGRGNAWLSCMTAEMNIAIERGDISRARIALDRLCADPARAESGKPIETLRRCELLRFEGKWQALRAYAAEQRRPRPTVPGGDLELQLELLELVGALHTGGKALDRDRLDALARRVEAMKTHRDRAWSELDLFEIERLSGVPASDLLPRIDRYIARCAAGGFGEGELTAQRERILVLARDHSPQLGSEVDAFVARATRQGYTRLAHEVARAGAAR